LNWKSPPVGTLGELNDLPSSAVTVWGWFPPLCHTTVEPAVTVTPAGSKCHFIASESESDITTRPSAA